METSLVAQMVKSLPAVRETWDHYLRGENTLEKEMATHSSSYLRILWMDLQREIICSCFISLDHPGGCRLCTHCPQHSGEDSAGKPADHPRKCAL